MKNSIGVLTTFTLMAAFVLSGCNSPSDKVEENESPVPEANRDLEIDESELEAELRIYRAEKEEQIEEYNQTIREIEEEIENESDDEVKVRLVEKLGELEASLRKLKHEMDNYETSGRENWIDFKNNFNRKMNDLGESLDNFFSTSDTPASSTLKA